MYIYCLFIRWVVLYCIGVIVVFMGVVADLVCILFGWLSISYEYSLQIVCQYELNY